MGIPAHTKDPVTERGTQKQPRCQRYQRQSPENFDGKLLAAAECGGEDRMGGAIPWCLVDAVHHGQPVGHNGGDPRRSAKENVRGAQRDDE